MTRQYIRTYILIVLSLSEELQAQDEAFGYLDNCLISLSGSPLGKASTRICYSYNYVYSNLRVQDALLIFIIMLQYVPFSVHQVSVNLPSKQELQQYVDMGRSTIRVVAMQKNANHTHYVVVAKIDLFGLSSMRTWDQNVLPNVIIQKSLLKIDLSQRARGHMSSYLELR